MQPIPVSRIDELERALASLTNSNVDGLITLADPFFTAHRGRIVDLANAARLPTMLHWREFVEAGGLLSYAPDNVELYRRAASFVDKILKGAKPGDLPIRGGRDLADLTFLFSGATVPTWWEHCPCLE